MKFENHKMHTDTKDGTYRTVLVKSDNSILKVMNADLPTEEVAKAIADNRNANNWNGTATK